jgi:hypothetical protein
MSENSPGREQPPGIADELLRFMGDSLSVTLSLIGNDLRFKSVSKTMRRGSVCRGTVSSPNCSGISLGRTVLIAFGRT